MAASRKLQGEIDRCLKKVAEGVETFEDIWQKVHNAANSNQKEKYEQDLKKEIKKLQRLRDQIKTWLSTSEIKDKTLLTEQRKLIETKMEKFKVVERETKTKAYSKEGLTAQQKLDPVQKEREEVNYWLASSIDQLNFQVDKFESELESLGTTGKKRKVNREIQDRIDDLKTRLERHRFHIVKLETLMRMLNNMSVEAKQIMSIKDDVDYYLTKQDECDQSEYDDDEHIYEGIVMDDIAFAADIGTTAKLGSPADNQTNSSGKDEEDNTPVSTNSVTTPVESPLTNNHSSEHSQEERDGKKSKPSQEDLISQQTQRSSVVIPGHNTISSSTSGPVSNPSSSKHATASPTKHLLNLSQSTPNNSSPSSGMTAFANPTAFTNHIPSSQNFAAAASANTQPVISSSPSSKGLHVLSNDTHPLPPPSSQQLPLMPAPSTPSQQKIINNLDHSSSSPSSVSPASPLSAPPTTPSPLTQPGQQPRSAVMNGPTTPKVSDVLRPNRTSVLETEGRTSLPVFESNKVQPSHVTEVHIPPLLALAPLGVVPLHKDQQYQTQMLEAAFRHMPQPADSMRLRNNLARTQCNIPPPHYPQVPPPHSDNVEFFQLLSTETLFFIFYYMEGSKAQYLAAKALKKQMWRFHTKYMMWFQRHDEPKTITNEYEQGTYIYFDYEKWVQRKKEDFTFEYRYLEDRDLN